MLHGEDRELLQSEELLHDRGQLDLAAGKNELANWKTILNNATGAGLLYLLISS